MDDPKIKDQNDLTSNPAASHQAPEMMDEEIKDGDSVLGHAPGGFEDANPADLDDLRKNQGGSVDGADGPVELNADADQAADVQKEWNT